MSENRGRRFLRALMKYIERSNAPTAARLDQLQREMRAYPTMGHVQAVVKEEFAKVQILKGEDGKSVTLQDVMPLLESWMAKCEIEAERRAQAKVDAALLVLQERMAQIPTQDSIDSRFDAHLARFEIDMDRRNQEIIARAVASLRQPEDGKDGASIEDFDLSVDGRIVTVTMRIGGRIVSKQVKIAAAHDAGVYKAGQAYDEGAIVTFGGSAFIAGRDAEGSEKPEASSAWRLLVKRGRDGKDAV